MASQDGPNDEFIKIFLLTPLSDERRAAYFGKFQDPEASEDDLEWVKPQFIKWPSDQREGSIEGGDLLRLFKKTLSDDPEAAEFQYFADRQSVDSGTVILAHRDPYTMLHSPKTAQDMAKLAVESRITLPANWALMDGLARGRIPQQMEIELVQRGYRKYAPTGVHRVL